MVKTVVRPVLATNASITYRCCVCGWEEEHLFWNDMVVIPTGSFQTHYCPDKTHPMWRDHEDLYEKKFGGD